MARQSSVDKESDFRVTYEYALQRAGTHSEYMASMNRQGIPDLYWYGRGVSGWQELKFVDQLPSRSSSSVLDHPLTGQQRLFLIKACEQGVLGVVAVGSPMALLGSPVSAIGVSFFWPHEFSEKGQITAAQLVQCRRRARVEDGVGCVRVLMAMAGEIKPQPGRQQMKLWR